ncbi:hypothetical protein [Streptomyces sp. t39]|uniref:hypothetical protein n=1 Tax=Streptomyces sp. t39 TaxID=1828156 RepID=UPI0011CE767C|nr:hypothetical protein [Streptomyces sp. t39]
MTAQGDSIVAFLERAIYQAEAGANHWHDLECDVHATSLIDVSVLHQATLCDCAGPTSVLRRCAADRKLIALHGGRGHGCPAYDYDGDLDEYARFYDHEVCPVVEHLAEGYGWTAGQTRPVEGDQVT